MNRKTLIVSLLIIAGTLILMGTTYAYFTAIAVSDEQVVKSGTLELTYHTGKDIQATNIIPTEEENAYVHQFTVENTGTLDVHYNISMSEISLLKDNVDVMSKNLSWSLYKTNENYSSEELVKNGNFYLESGYIEGTKELVIKTGIELSPQEKDYYVLKVWLQETGRPQDEDQGLNLTMKIQVDTLEKNESVAISLMRERNLSNSDFYQYSENITKVIFQNKMEPIETELSWDISKYQDKNCMAYLVLNEEETEPTYTLYIQGNDKVYLDSMVSLFENFIHLLEIEGLEYVDTSRVTNMINMFYACSSLTNLDLSNFDTSQVLFMHLMFYGCSSLTELDLSSFDTSQVAEYGMSVMFYGCINLEKLNIKNFTYLYNSFDSDSAWMEKMENLKYLDMSDANINLEGDTVAVLIRTFKDSYVINGNNNGQIIVKDEEIKALFEEQLAQYNQVPEYADFNINIILASN